jgi:hypothetical protein
MRFSTSAPCPWKTLSPTPAVQDMLTWSQSAHELPADQLQYASHAPDREALSKNGQSSRSDRSASVTDKKDLLGHREVCLNWLQTSNTGRYRSHQVTYPPLVAVLDDVGTGLMHRQGDPHRLMTAHTQTNQQAAQKPLGHTEIAWVN